MRRSIVKKSRVEYFHFFVPVIQRISCSYSPLIQQTSEDFTIKEVSADLAYSSKKYLEFVESVGGIPYIPFNKNVTVRARGSVIWIKMFHYFQLNKEFMEHYHKRSNIESTNAAIKRKFGEALKSKNWVA